MNNAEDKNLQARDFMNTHVKTVTPDMTLHSLIRFLHDHQISNAPVVRRERDGRKTLIGFVTEGDCLRALAGEIFYGAPISPKSVEMIMRLHPVSVGPKTDVFTLASVLTSLGYRHLPVVEDHHLLGIVSRRDILKALEEYVQEQIGKKQPSFPPSGFGDRVHQRFLLHAGSKESGE